MSERNPPPRYIPTFTRLRRPTQHQCGTCGRAGDRGAKTCWYCNGTLQ